MLWRMHWVEGAWNASASRRQLACSTKTITIAKTIVNDYYLAGSARIRAGAAAKSAAAGYWLCGCVAGTAWAQKVRPAGLVGVMRLAGTTGTVNVRLRAAAAGLADEAGAELPVRGSGARTRGAGWR